VRLDQALVARGLAPSRARAQALVAAGVVAVDGARAAKPAQSVDLASEITVSEDPCPWVGRGALKLLHALDAFGLTPADAVALDLGASTGGFTEVLLARGAARVHAVDVGTAQLHPSLRADPRVSSHEGVNARDLRQLALPPLDWIVADVSFISLTLALPPALALARPGATLVALVKPQFEAGREAVGRGGLIRDPAALNAARARVRDFLTGAGWTVTHEGESPIAGGEGAKEFLLAARAPLDGGPAPA
jgi:23S rRNA (cytidine1920-2'-O)/16S rRNA (cytidine1409-2'-O)-methyltransferase